MVEYGYLRESYGDFSPIVSVYLSLRRQPADGGRELALRWRALRSRLVSQAASDAELEPVDERVYTANVVDRTLVAFVREGRLDFSDELDDCSAPDAASFGPLPLGVPMLRWQQQWVPYIVASVDRTLGELAGYRGFGSPVAAQVVVGPDDEIERNAPGGWAQGRYQHRAEDSWAHNAATVAAQVERMAAQVGAQLLITSGDGRAIQLLTAHLPDRLKAMHRTVTSGVEYTPGGRPRPRPETVREMVHEAATAARARSMKEFEDSATGKACATGLSDTIQALQACAVRHLFVVQDPRDRRIVRVSADPLRIGVDGSTREHIAERGSGPAEHLAPLSEALVRAAFAQSADVTVLGADEAELPDGVAALRF